MARLQRRVVPMIRNPTIIAGHSARATTTPTKIPSNQFSMSATPTAVLAPTAKTGTT